MENQNKQNILEVFQLNLNNRNFDFVKKHILEISPSDLLLPYNYDKEKTILEVVLSNNLIGYFGDNQIQFFVQDARAAIIILNNEDFAKGLLEMLEGDKQNEIVETLLDTLIAIKDSNAFLNFVSKNFDRIKDNSYLKSILFLNDDILTLFMKHGIFSPIVGHEHLICSSFKGLDGLTILEYALSRKEKGETIDIGIDFFDQKMIESLNYQKVDARIYVEIYCKFRRFEPFSRLNIDALDMSYRGKSVLEYIFSINPNFTINQISNNPSIIFSLVNEYIKVGNWSAIQPHLKHFYHLFFPFSNGKLYIEIFIENNVEFTDEVCDFVGKMLSSQSDDVLLRKDEKGITLLERLMKINPKIGGQVALASFNKDRKVQIQTAIILARYGWKSKVECDDQYMQDFEQYLNELTWNFIQNKYFAFRIDDDELKNEVRGVFKEFWEYFGGSSHDELIKLVLNIFWKYLTVDKNMAIQYLTNFIERKKQDPKFSLRYAIEDESSYSNIDGVVTVNKYNPYTLMHEVGHSVHDFKGNSEYPEHIRVMIEELKKDPATIARLQVFAMQVQETVEERMGKLGEQFYGICDASYFEGIRADYTSIVDNPEELIARFSTRTGGTCDVEAIRKLLNGMQTVYSYDEYYRMTLANDKNEYISKFINAQFAGVFMIENLMDAIFDGRWLSEMLSGVTAKCYSGHGVKYYRQFSAFEEIYANISGLMFGVITGVDGIEAQLRYLLGDELLDVLIEYHQELNQSQGKSK